MIAKSAHSLGVHRSLELVAIIRPVERKRRYLAVSMHPCEAWPFSCGWQLRWLNMPWIIDRPGKCLSYGRDGTEEAGGIPLCCGTRHRVSCQTAAVGAPSGPSTADGIIAGRHRLNPLTGRARVPSNPVGLGLHNLRPCAW